MRNIVLLLLFFVVPVFILAQKTSVTGNVIDGNGQVIRLLAYDDFISNKIITLGESEVADDGSFSIDFELKETLGAFLDINYQRAELFVEPDNTYELNITYNAANQLESYFDRQGLVFSFQQEDQNELNRLIWKFNEMYNKFVMENFEHIVKLHDKSRVTDFKEIVEQTFNGVEHTYFNDYVTYKLADVYQFARLKGRRILADEYFTGKTVLYNNVEYTFFFEEFFAKYLTTNPDIITISDLIIAVNDNQSIAMIEEVLAQVPYLQEAGFRELVLIYCLRSLYFDGTYKKPQLLSMIGDIHKTTTDPMHKKITGNLLESLSRLAPGSPAPDLLLTSIGGLEFNLKNLHGKPILLNFFNSSRKGTQNAFDMLAELYNLYKSGLEIISISMDDDPSAYMALANSGGYHWTFAHYGNDPKVLDKYNIRNLPLYVLIDADGNIARYPAPAPGQELENAVMKIIH